MLQEQSSKTSEGLLISKDFWKGHRCDIETSDVGIDNSQIKYTGASPNAKWVGLRNLSDPAAWPEQLNADTSAAIDFKIWLWGSSIKHARSRSLSRYCRFSPGFVYESLKIKLCSIIFTVFF